jgi:aminopeptidase-like protein
VAARPQRHFGLALVFCPEIVGSAVYLDRDVDRQRVRFALCPNLLGHDAPLAICRSKHGDSRLDRALVLSALERNVDHVAAPWHTYPDAGDEISYDAPGYGIPTSTVSRMGELFGEYHSSLDTPEIVEPGRFDVAVDVMAGALAMLDADRVLVRTFEGNPCLANPEVDLYLDPSNVNNRRNRNQTAFLTDLRTGKELEPRNFQELFLSNLEGRASILDIAFAAGVPFDFVHGYALRFVEKGLARELLADDRAGGPVVPVSLALPGHLDLGSGDGRSD